jgi:hypothetical protein
LNRRQPYRARFTLAHEIAHTMIDPPTVRKAAVELAARRPRGGDELERLCDEIAVELLLPYEMFARSVPQPLTLTGVFGLAKTYDASLQATALRAGELAQEPIQVVVWERDGRSRIRAKAARGREYLTGDDAAERSMGDDTPIARAFIGKDAERGLEVADPDSPLAYDCEARGFLRGEARFVISIVRPATAQARVRGSPKGVPLAVR